VGEGRSLGEVSFDFLSLFSSRLVFCVVLCIWFSGARIGDVKGRIERGKRKRTKQGGRQEEKGDGRGGRRSRRGSVLIKPLPRKCLGTLILWLDYRGSEGDVNHLSILEMTVESSFQIWYYTTKEGVSI
jgi:hypothetical protein